MNNEIIASGLKMQKFGLELCSTIGSAFQSEHSRHVNAIYNTNNNYGAVIKMLILLVLI